MSLLWKNSIGINSLANNKAPDIDEVSAEVWKSGTLSDQLLDVCHMMLKGGEKPESIITPIAIKGDLSEPQNYRAIGLASTMAKVYNRMLLDRICLHFDPLLRKNQNGFRSGRSTVCQTKAKNLTPMHSYKANLTFVEIKKPFELVNREKLFDILKTYSIPYQIVTAIVSMYKNIEAKVCSPDRESNFFTIHAGSERHFNYVPVHPSIKIHKKVRN